MRGNQTGSDCQSQYGHPTKGGLIPDLVSGEQDHGEIHQGGNLRVMPEHDQGNDVGRKNIGRPTKESGQDSKTDSPEKDPDKKSQDQVIGDDLEDPRDWSQKQTHGVGVRCRDQAAVGRHSREDVWGPLRVPLQPGPFRCKSLFHVRVVGRAGQLIGRHERLLREEHGVKEYDQE